MIKRTPNDPAWYKGGLFHDNMRINIPGFWFMSWYDVSVGPNLEMFNHVRRTAKAPMKDQQWAVIAPVAHCAYTRAAEQSTSYYGQLARAKLGLPQLELNGVPTGRGRGVERLEIVRAVQLLYELDERELALPIFGDMGENGDADALAGLGELTSRHGDARGMLLLG